MRFKVQLLWSAALIGLFACAKPPENHSISLDDALKTIESKPFVELTHPFSPTTPVWSGFPQAAIMPAADPKTRRPYTIEKDGFRASVYSLVGQYGTHIDSPAHFSPDGLTLDRIPLQQMILPLEVIDMTPMIASEPNHALTVDDLRVWEKSHGQFRVGSFVALRTDMYKDWDSDPMRFKRSPFPAWSLAAIKFLIEERKISAIGHESLDTDTTEKMESETWILQHNHFQVEAMMNLDKVPATGAIIVVTWPKVEGGFGFPARAFAILP
jgi:kynurenine formamidase